MGLSEHSKDIIAGTTGGIAQVLVGQPFDIVKVRVQTSPQGMYSGVVDCVTKTFKNEGPFAFYKVRTPLLYNMLTSRVRSCRFWVSAPASPCSSRRSAR